VVHHRREGAGRRSFEEIDRHGVVQHAVHP
jgi:hypothetical protein